MNYIVRLFKKIAFLCFLITLNDVSGFSQSQRLIYLSLGPHDFKNLYEQKKEDAVLIDIRTQKETIGGKMADAMITDFFSNLFESDISKLDRKSPVFLYCGSGIRSRKALKVLERLGFQEVYELNGGYSGWKATFGNE
jgi:rhodanese-related sulfurtransferase